MQESKLFAWLAYLGTIPFIVGAILISLGHPSFFVINDPVSFVSSYGLIIVVFMSGIHWGQYISVEVSHLINLLISSNIITLLTWFAYLFASVQVALISYCLSFFVLLLIDAKLKSVAVITANYFRTRLIVTTIVIISLVISLVNL